MSTTQSAMAAGETRPTAESGGETSAQLEHIDAEVRAFVKERPILALVGVVVAGYVIGRLLRGRG
jgi:hypothetical protein